jgi:hypothetical protein
MKYFIDRFFVSKSPFMAATFVASTLQLTSLFAAPTDPEQVFRKPPEDARPGVWWHWMGTNVSAKGITADLEAFADAGIASATIFGMADVCTPWAGHIENSPTDGLLAFTDPWWKLVRHAAAEGKRLGIDVGIHNCPGYTSTGGPWVTPELAMQQIFSSSTNVEAGKTFDGVLPKPQINPQGDMLFPMINKETGKLEKPVIEGRKTFWREIAVLAVPSDGVIAKDAVIDLTKNMDAEGRLKWTAPASAKWTILRFGHTTMGALTQPNQWEVMGLECDKMNAKAVEFHLNHVIGQLKEHLGPLMGTGLRHMLLDSYEAGNPSWTPLMPQEFEKRRGYAIRAFLPTFAGRVVGSDVESKKFRSDFDRTIADLYRDVLFVTMERMLAVEKIRFVCEPYGGPFQTGEVAPHVHRVMTEFWSGDSFGNGVQGGIMNAGEGKLHNILEAEAFTGQPSKSQWTETPAWLKGAGDGAFCAGINRFILHTNPHQPWNDRVKPGMTMGQWGSHFGRTQTWWEPGKAWLAYLARCQALLQWGTHESSNASSFVSIEGEANVKSVHRKEGDRHAFFIANLGKNAGKVLGTFRAGNQVPELWDPVTGTMRELTDFRNEGGATRLLLELAPQQSYFIVFRKAASAAKPTQRNFSVTQEVGALQGAWQVSFDPAWGGPEQAVTFSELSDWTSHAEAGIRYYSGTAVYRKKFDLVSAPKEESLLDLGIVHHLAQVRLNDRDLGVVWCDPWQVRVPAGLLKATGNRLEIAATNVWANRLIGDEQQPADTEWLPGYMGGQYLKRFPDWFVKGSKRPSAERYTFTTWNYFTKDSKLTPSGLLGPVRVMAQDWQQSASTLTEELMAKVPAHLDTESPDGFEADLPNANSLIELAGIEESGSMQSEGGAKDASPIHNGTTRNGSGTAETKDDGKTYRGYGDGNSVTFRIKNPQGENLTEIRSFAGHPDARASQHYSVWIAKADAPGQFIKVKEVKAQSSGGGTQLRVKIDAKQVVAVRLDFGNGSAGFNVYREICLLGSTSN